MADLQIATSKLPSQIASAKAYYQAVLAYAQANNIPTNKITFTGHSLGGGLAQYLAATLFQKGMTFNAVGMKNLIAQAVDAQGNKLFPSIDNIHFSNIDNWQVHGDFVTSSYNQVGQNHWANVDIKASLVGFLSLGILYSLARHNSILFNNKDGANLTENSFAPNNMGLDSKALYAFRISNGVGEDFYTSPLGTALNSFGQLSHLLDRFNLEKLGNPNNGMSVPALQPSNAKLEIGPSTVNIDIKGTTPWNMPGSLVKQVFDFLNFNRQTGGTSPSGSAYKGHIRYGQEDENGNLIKISDINLNADGTGTLTSIGFNGITGAVTASELASLDYNGNETPISNQVFDGNAAAAIAAGVNLQANQFYVNNQYTWDQLSAKSGVAATILENLNQNIQTNVSNQVLSGQVLNLPAPNNTSAPNIQTYTNLGPVSDPELDTTIVTNTHQGYISREAAAAVSYSNGELDKTDIFAVSAAGLTSGGYRPGALQPLPGPTGTLPPMPTVVPSDAGVFINPGYKPPVSMEQLASMIQARGYKDVYVDPLMLDLSGNGINTTSLQTAPVLFDMDHSGKLQRTGWADNLTGMLVIADSNGQVTSISQMFSPYFGGAQGSNGGVGQTPFSDGFAALAAQDANHDLKIDNNDPIWSQLRVWVDANHNAKTDTGDLKTLSELGITQLNLTKTSVNQSNNGNLINLTGTFVMNGQTRTMSDVHLISDPTSHAFTASGSNEILTSTIAANSITMYLEQTAQNSTLDAATLGVNNIYGSEGNNTLIAKSTGSWLVGGGGNDTYQGGIGDDLFIISKDDNPANVHGGGGKDMLVITGNVGKTVNMAQSQLLFTEGGAGDDVIMSGGRTGVYIKGGSGNSLLIGGAGDDVISGGSGKNTIIGGTGKSVIHAGPNGDLIYGAAKDSIIYAGGGEDTIVAGAGNDVIHVGRGNAEIDGGAGVNVAGFHGSYADYRIVKVDGGYWVSDRIPNRDGTVYLKNIQKFSFSDLSLIDLSLPNALVVPDALTVDKNGNAFNRSQAHTIAASQLINNDHPLSSVGILHISAVSDAVGGTASITSGGDVLFTPDPAFKGLMSFKYTVADSQGHPASDIQDLATGQTAPMRAIAAILTPDMPTDPLAAKEWYLTDANILAVWKDYTGQGIRIGQFEPSGPFAIGPEILDYHHPDLAPNIDQSWFTSQQAAMTLPASYSNHATMVAGVMVAAKNGIGAVGVAYDAKLGAYNTSIYTDNNGQTVSGIGHMIEFDVVNNSWGVTPDFAFPGNQQVGGTIVSSIGNAARNGRGGLGTIVVGAAGNTRASGGTAQGSVNNNNRFTIQVGAINEPGDLSTLTHALTPFSNPGSSILVSAAGSNIASTSQLVATEQGSIFGNNTSVLNGTSFATPVVSGIAALMLQANPNLGYRDVQTILALSSRKITDPNTIWANNGATNWNGGGMHFSYDYGFGNIDALAAVRLAESWTLQSKASNEVVFSAQSTASSSINPGASLTSSLAISSGIQVEHVEVDLNFSGITHIGDITVKLVSPDGTQSALLSVNDPTITQNSLNYMFMTTHDWGEQSDGNWTLQVTNNTTGNTINFGTWKLRVYGSQVTVDDTYYYTNEYASQVAVNSSRAILHDSTNGTSGGINSINAAAVSGNTTINLSTGVASIAGTSLTIQNPNNFNNLYSGDGDDTLTANNNKSILFGGRGNNVLVGGTGQNLFVVMQRENGQDAIYNFASMTEQIDLVGFSGISFNNLTFTQQGSDVSIGGLGSGQSILVKNITVTSLTSSNFVFQDTFAAPSGYTVTGGTNNIIPSGMSVQNLSGGWTGTTITIVNGQTTIKLNGTVYQHDLATADDFVITYQQAPAGNRYENALQGFKHGIDKIDLRQVGVTNYSDLTFSSYVAGQLNGVTIQGTKIFSTSLGSTGQLMELLYLDAISPSQIMDTDFIFAPAAPGTITPPPASPDTPINTVPVNTIDPYIIGSNNGVNTSQSNGTTTIESSVNYTLPENINRLTLTGTSDISGTGNNNGDVITGNTGENVLLGGTGNDSLVGNAGNDTLVGLAGQDTLAGGLGYDEYDFILGDGQDLIQESDTVNLVKFGAGITPANTQFIAQGNDLKIIYGSSGDQIILTNQLALYSTTQVNQFIFSNGATLTDEDVTRLLTGSNNIYGTDNADTLTNSTATPKAIYGYGGSDSLTSGTANDTLLGGLGNDTLNGQSGNDSLDGGSGNDTYLFANAWGADVISDDSSGNDTLDFSSVTSNIAVNLGAASLQVTAGANSVSWTNLAIENVIGGSGNDSLIGSAGDNVLNGGAGVDTLTGGTGNDTYVVDNINDQVVEALNEGTDTVQSSVSYTLASNVENLTLTGSANITGTGNTLDNNLTGNTGNNTLDGGTGNDTYVFNGAWGADVISGESAGNDTLDFSSITANVTANLGAGSNQISDGINSVSWSGVLLENIRTGSGDDTISGTAGNNSLIGSSGNDSYQNFSATSGNDTISDSIGADNAVFNALTSAITWSAVDTDNDTFVDRLVVAFDANNKVNIDNYFDNSATTAVASIAGSGAIESLVFSNDADVNFAEVQALVTSNPPANLTLTGTSGPDTLTGGAGNDTINALAGNDSLVGNAGNDSLDGATGVDTMLGGLGNDTYVVDDANDVVTENANEGTDLVQSVINYTLGSNVENLTLTGAANINGTGNTLDNVITGNTGNNILDGGTGTDTLSGGLGNDTYVVDSTTDTITENTNEGTDTVQSSVTYTLGSNLENLVLTGSAAINATGNTLDNVLTGNSGNNSLSGGSGNDAYQTFSATSGNDTISDSAGATDSAIFNALTTAATWSAVDSNADTFVDQLVVSFDANNKVTINNYFNNTATSAASSTAGSGAIESLVFNNDSDVNFTDVQALIIPSQSLTGTTGNDTLTGGAGNDTLNGLAGNDSLVGNAGNDTYIFQANAGNDTVNDSAGNDSFDFSSYTTALNVNLANTSVNLGGGVSPNVNKTLFNLNAQSNGSNTLTDIYGNTWTAVGNANIQSANSWKTGEKYIALDGNGDYVQNTSMAITGNSFTIHWRQMFNALNESNQLIQTPADYGFGIDFYYNKLEWYLSSNGTSWNISSGDYSANFSWNTGQWYDFEFTYSNTTGYKLFVDGVQQMSSSNTAKLANMSNGLLFGGIPTPGNDVNGAIGDIYITNGEQIHSSAFTPSTSSMFDLYGSSGTATSVNWGSSVIENIQGGSANDILVGNTQNNLLQGNVGTDSLTGDAGNDTLDGGTGADTMVGGLGNDTFIVDNASDVVTESASEGTDVVQSSVTYTLGSNLENLILTGSAAINATGNTLDNVLTGNSGNNSLAGSSGNDTYQTFSATSGNDTITDSAGTTDSAIFNALTTGATWSAVDTNADTFLDQLVVTFDANNKVSINNYFNNTATTAAASTAGSGAIESLVFTNDTDVNFSDVQALLPVTNLTLNGTTGNDTLTGGTGNDTLNGLAGNDSLVGNGGNDSLDGGTGIDTMVGGLGNDIYVVDGSTDVVTENASEGTDTVQSSVTLTLATNVENLTLTGTSAINGTGNTLDNVITGNSGDNTLDGAAGTDTLLGGLGNDTYIVDSTTDTITENTSEGTDTVQSSVSYTLGANLEKLTLTGTGNINGIGNTLDNIITANSGNNSLSGGAGNDTYQTFSATSGNDTITDSAGALDNMIFNALTTAASWSAVDSNADTFLDQLVVSFDANNKVSINNYFNNTATTAAASTAGSGAIESLVFNNDSDVNFTDVQALLAQITNQTLNGTTGNDTLTAGAGNDTLNGLAGNDSLIGNAGNDSLDGGTGNDTMLGGLGDDIYVVDSATDVVTENANEGIDTVQSGISYTLGTNVENLLLAGTGNTTGTGNSLNNVITGNSGNNTLDGSTGTDTLVGGTGNDSYIIDSATDTITENLNEGTDTIQSSVTYTLGNNLEHLTLTGGSNINGIGNSLNNVITGNSGNNSLDGSTGVDTLVGGLGDDTYVVDNTSDVITENLNEGTDVVQSNVNYTLSANVENLSLTGTGDITGTGNALNNLITANTGNNTLDGGLGNDTLNGGAGNDTYVIGLSAGTDSIQDSAGVDTLDFNQQTANLSVDLTTTSTSIASSPAPSTTQSLLLFNGTDGSQTITDSFGNAWTTTGNANIQSASTWKAGEKYLDMDGSGDNVKSTTMNPNGNNFTLRFRVRFDNINSPYTEFLSSVAGQSFALRRYTNYLTLSLSSNNSTWDIGGAQGTKTSWTAGQWYDIEFSYSSSSGYRVFVDGVQDIYLSSTTKIYNPGGIVIGTSPVNSYGLDGGIADVYLTNTQTLHTANFTPLTQNYGSTFTSTTSWDVGSMENVIGGSGNDSLTGSTANNVLQGNAGNDTLNGGTAADSLSGGLGNDTYLVDDAGDVVTENASEGTDTILSSLSYTLGNNVENLTLTGSANLAGTGNSLNNVITGNSGNNTLDGSTGTDTLVGGTGNDTYIVDSTTDTITENSAEGTDTIQSSVTYTLGSNLENLVLTGSAAINGTGNTLDNVFTGNSGNNSLSGSSGNDTYQTFSATSGNDTITDSAGTTDSAIFNALTTGATWSAVDTNADTFLDQLVVTFDANNKVSINNYFNNTATTAAASTAGSGTIESLVFTNDSDVNFADVQALLVTNQTLNGTTGNDTLTGGAGNDTLNGLAGNDSLVGNGGNDSLDGGTGVDTMVGGLGNDIYVVDGSTDVVTENASEGTDAVQSSVTLTLATNVENLTLTGSNATNGTGNTLDNYLTGNSGNNSLSGSSSNDTLDGAAGTDTLVGGTGNDTYIVDTTTDTLTENASEGTDTVQSTVTLTLATNIENLLLMGSSAINGTGNTLDNYLTGNSGNNSLSGSSGNDTLDGGAGTDTLVGGTGNDTFIVDSTTDTITENASEGTDLVQSSVSYTLGANLENLTLTGTGNINATGNTLNNILTGNTGNNSLIGGAGNDSLVGDAGDDTYSFTNGFGVDTITDSNGSDTLDFSSHSGGLTVDLSTTNMSVGGGVSPNSNKTLLNLNGQTNGSSTMVDIYGNTWTAYGNANIQSTSSWKSGEKYIALDGNGDYIRNTSMALTGDAFTIHWRQKFNSINEFNQMIQTPADYGFGIDFYYNKLEWYLSSNGTSWDISEGDYSANFSWNTGQWYDFEFTYSNTTGYKLFVDGVLQISDNNTSKLANMNAGVLIGGLTTPGYDVDGAIADIYVTNGEQLHSSAFTPSTSSMFDLYGGGTSDSITWGANTVENVTGSTGNDTLTGTSVANILKGSAGNDTINAAAGTDELTGGTGVDSLIGGTGNDTYKFAKGDGLDTINDGGTTSDTLDTVLFDSSVIQSEVALWMNGTNLEIGYTSNSTDKITIINQTTAANDIDKLQLNSGYYLTDANINQIIQDMTAYATNHSISLTSLNDVKNDANLLAIVNSGWHT